MKGIAELKKNEILEILTQVYFPQTAPTDDASVISGLNFLRSYQRLLENPEKEEQSQRRPVEAGQKSSDSKVSIFVVFL